MPSPPQHPKPSAAYVASRRQQMSAAPSTQKMDRDMIMAPINEYTEDTYTSDFKKKDFPDGIFTKGNAIPCCGGIKCCIACCNGLCFLTAGFGLKTKPEGHSIYTMYPYMKYAVEVDTSSIQPRCCGFGSGSAPICCYPLYLAMYNFGCGCPGCCWSCVPTEVRTRKPAAGSGTPFCEPSARCSTCDPCEQCYFCSCPCCCCQCHDPNERCASLVVWAQRALVSVAASAPTVFGYEAYTDIDSKKERNGSRLFAKYAQQLVINVMTDCGCVDLCGLFGLCGLIETGKCPATAGCPRAFPCCSLIPCCCGGSVVALQSIPLNGAFGPDQNSSQFTVDRRAGTFIWPTHASKKGGKMPTPPNYDGPHSKHTNVKEGEVGSKVILYLHGGIFAIAGADLFVPVIGMPLAHHADCVVCVPEYPFIGENPFPAQLDAMTRLYGILCRDYGPENVVLMGDSAGGTLCLGTAINATNHCDMHELTGKPMGPAMAPGGIVLQSPWVDPNPATFEEGADKQFSAWPSKTINSANVGGFDGVGEARPNDKYNGETANSETVGTYGAYKQGHPIRGKGIIPLLGDAEGAFAKAYAMADQRGNYYTEMEYPSSNEPWVTKISRDPSSFYPAGADKALIEKQALANPINATFEQLSNLRAGSVQLSWGYGLEGQECLVPKEDCPLDKVLSGKPFSGEFLGSTQTELAHKLMNAGPKKDEKVLPVLERVDVHPVPGMPHVFNELGGFMVWNSTVPGWRRGEPDEFAPIMIFNKQLEFVHKRFGDYRGCMQRVERGWGPKSRY